MSPETGFQAPAEANVALVDAVAQAGEGGQYQLLRHDEVRAENGNRFIVEDDELLELRDTIKEHGVEQPISVRVARQGEAPGYIIIAGERRWRAASLAGIRHIPCMVHPATISDLDVRVKRLIENTQRKNLAQHEDAKQVAATWKEMQADAVRRGLPSPTRKALATLIGRTEPVVSNLLQIAENDEVLTFAEESGTNDLELLTAIRKGLEAKGNKVRKAREVMRAYRTGNDHSAETKAKLDELVTTHGDQRTAVKAYLGQLPKGKRGAPKQKPLWEVRCKNGQAFVATDTRRPFTVADVVALQQAVSNAIVDGTGAKASS